MSEESRALRLANSTHLAYRVGWQREAAAELRRLHQFAEDQIGRATAAEAALQMTKATHALKIAAVETQRDALLEALRLVQVDCQYLHHEKKDQHALSQPCPVVDRINAAIKAVEENT